MKFLLSIFTFLTIIHCTNLFVAQSIPESLKTRFKLLNESIEKNNGGFNDYFNRAQLYKSIGALENAKSDYTAALNLESDASEKTLAHINRGNIFQQEENYSKAQNDFEKATEILPTSSSAWNNLGYVQFLMNSFPASETSLKKAIDLDIHNTNAFVNLTALYSKQNKHIEALAVCDQLIKDNPDPKSYIHKAEYYQAIGKLNLALLEWNKAVILSKDNPDYLVERSKFKDDILNDDAGAVEDCKKAIAKNSGNANYYYNLTRPLYDLEEYDAVLANSDIALKINPNYYEALIMRANTLDLYGKTADAKRDYFKAMSVNPTDFESYMQLSILYSNALQYDSAQITVDSYIKKDPTNYKMLVQSAKLQVANKQIEKAITSLNSIAKNYPEKPDAFFLLGYLQDSLGKKNDACSNMNLAYEKGAGQALLYLIDNCPILLKPTLVEQFQLSKKAYDYEQQGNFQKALETCSELIKIAPDSAIYYYNRGKEYRYLNQHLNAIKDYKKAINLDSNAIDYWVSMAVSYSYLNQTEDAITTYNNALKIDPTSAMCYYNLGNIYASQGNFEKAIVFLIQATEYKYDYGNAYLSLGDCFIELKEYSKACENYKNAEKLQVSQAFAKRIRYCK